MKDPILELVVKFAEAESPLETPITLLVDGLMVSGYVMSKDKYMRHNDLTKEIESAFERALAEIKEEKPEDDGKRRFIHLRDAKYFAPGQSPVPTNESVVCRVRIAKVSAFHFGCLSVSGER